MGTVGDLIRYIEGRFPCREGIPYHTCQTGDSYVVLGEDAGKSIDETGGILVEGYSFKRRYSDEKTAIEGAKRCFDAYAVGKTGVLYWRYENKMAATCHLEDGGALTLSMRLCISDKPEIYQRAEGIEAARGEMRKS